MKSHNEQLKIFSLITTLVLVTTIVNADDTLSIEASEESTTKLLSANFEARNVVQIEAGDFHFTPGQIAPIHTHVAPALGYVAKGEILYQVEGEKPQILREGQAFYEPAGPRILRFDNASATEEAVFIDFNLQQEGEPFIVFEQTPTEHIDRRMLPTVLLDGQSIDRMDIFVTELEPGGRKKLTKSEDNPLLGYVAEGIVKLKIKGKNTQRIVAGGSYSLTNKSKASIVNVSTEVPAKVISFYLY